MATKSFVIEMPEEQLADIDRVRGTIPRQTWVKDLLRAAVQARDAFDGPCWLRIKATERNGEMPEGVHQFMPLPD